MVIEEAEYGGGAEHNIHGQRDQGKIQRIHTGGSWLRVEKRRR